MMSSPSVGKDIRPVTALSQDYHTTVGELETYDLLKSTFTEETRPILASPGVTRRVSVFFLNLNIVFINFIFRTCTG